MIGVTTTPLRIKRLPFWSTLFLLGFNCLSLTTSAQTKKFVFKFYENLISVDEYQMNQFFIDAFENHKVVRKNREIANKEFSSLKKLILSANNTNQYVEFDHLYNVDLPLTFTKFDFNGYFVNKGSARYKKLTKSQKRIIKIRGAFLEVINDELIRFRKAM